MNKLRQLAIFICALITISAAAQTNTSRVYRDGSGWVEEVTGTLPAARNLRVNTEVGSVHVNGGTQQTVSYTIRKRVFHSSEEAARREMQNITVTAVSQGDTAVFGGEWHEERNHRGSVDFNISVPRELTVVKIDTSGGAIGVRNISGRLEAHTMGGGIDLDQIGGLANVHTMGGGINAGSITGEARLETAGGSIHIESAGARLYALTAGGTLDIGTVAGPADVKTAGGSIRVRQTGGELIAVTAGGSINIGDVNGAATLRTAGGSIRLNSARGFVNAESGGGGTVQLMNIQGGAHVENGAGGITVELVGDRIQTTRLETGNGDIVLYLSPRIACTVRAEVDVAGSPGIQSDFSEIRVSTEQNGFGPRPWHASGSLNGGGPLVQMSTSVGRIEIHKSK